MLQQKESQIGNTKKASFHLDTTDYTIEKLKKNNCTKSIERNADKLKEILADWLFLLFLGVVCAFINIFIEMLIFNLQEVQRLTVSLPFFHFNPSSWAFLVISFISWSIYTVGLVAASATFAHYVSVQAIGSGIPEIKTIIRGVVLKNYLSFSTLISKVFGIAMALGSGIPIGKMGPFCHIAACVANLMSNVVSRFSPAFANKTRRMEAFSAACAVAVASTFSAPIGVTVNAFYQTSFGPTAFGVPELPLFALLGILCGLIGSLYISFYRSLVLFLRNNSIAKRLFQQHWLVYPLVVSSIFAIMAYPHGIIAQFCRGRFVFSIISLTLPVPSGVFLPVFVLGAGIGRLYGEIAVLISNAVCAYLQPSLFDTMIKIKHLPFLPDLPPTSALVHQIVAENIMVTPVLHITKITSYESIRNLLFDNRLPRVFPVVDSASNQILIGTVPRYMLVQLLDAQIGPKARKLEAERRVKNAIQMIDAHFRNAEDAMNDRKMRISSDSNLIGLEKRKTSKREVDFRHNELEMENNKRKKGLRFLVVPTTEYEHELSKKKESGCWRRNAVCQMNKEHADKLEDIEETHSERSHTIDRKYRTIHSLSSEYHSFVRGYIHQAKKYLHLMHFGHKMNDDKNNPVYDLTPKEREEWEREKLKEEFELTDEDIDPAPFSLVKKTSLYRIHSIFSMMQLNIAFVTECGRLIGCVGLADVRRALDESKTRKKQEIREVEGPSELNAEQEIIIQKPSINVIDILTPMPEVGNKILSFRIKD
ncbi:hypothetical protein WR25_14953 isoform D [Diploscapter pachys]|uniref:Uncharacterized protein n=1 Tax=Diploscapter pachys TaxID=2018661 RepID=A0A2A2LS57_9BILA|nr:hypothetical protein WR25_14953 isoform C [Diploscapter pachys]PAV88999.1 hypothetical protein WR25_14953 isoform D [Diploscapter pachys]